MLMIPSSDNIVLPSRLTQQKKEKESLGQNIFYSSSLRSIEVNQNKNETISPNSNNKVLTELSKPMSSNKRRGSRKFDFEQSDEQKQFQNEFMERIRNKQQNKQMGISSKDQYIQQQSIYDQEKSQFGQQNEKTQHKNMKEMLEELHKIIEKEIASPKSQLNQNWGSLLREAGNGVVISSIENIFQNTLIDIFAQKEEIKLKNSSFKIPETLLSYIQNIFSTKVLSTQLGWNQQKANAFKESLLTQYKQCGSKPENLIELLGGKSDCQKLIRGFYQIFSQTKQQKIPEKLVIDIGLACLEDDDIQISKNVSILKQMYSIVVSNSDLCILKYHIYKYMEKEEYKSFPDSTKIQILQLFEDIRFRQFSPDAEQMKNNQNLVKDIIVSIATKKELREYFIKADDPKEIVLKQNESDKEYKFEYTKEEQEQHSIETSNLKFFVTSMLDCLSYRVRPSQVAYWLSHSLLKPLDDNFFRTLKPLFVQQLKRCKVSTEFMRQSSFNLFWIETHCNVSFQEQDIFDRIDEIIQHLTMWIQKVITSKQIKKNWQDKIEQVSDTSFIKYFICTLLCPADTYQMISIFHTSLEVLQFQFKALHRIFLHMKFKPNTAYEMTEFINQAFTQSLSL